MAPRRDKRREVKRHGVLTPAHLRGPDAARPLAAEINDPPAREGIPQSVHRTDREQNRKKSQPRKERAAENCISFSASCPTRSFDSLECPRSSTRGRGFCFAGGTPWNGVGCAARRRSLSQSSMTERAYPIVRSTCRNGRVSPIVFGTRLRSLYSRGPKRLNGLPLPSRVGQPRMFPPGLRLFFGPVARKLDAGAILEDKGHLPDPVHREDVSIRGRFGAPSNLNAPCVRP